MSLPEKTVSGILQTKNMLGRLDAQVPLAVVFLRAYKSLEPEAQTWFLGETEEVDLMTAVGNEVVDEMALDTEEIAHTMEQLHEWMNENPLVTAEDAAIWLAQSGDSERQVQHQRGVVAKTLGVFNACWMLVMMDEQKREGFLKFYRLVERDAAQMRKLPPPTTLP